MNFFRVQSALIAGVQAVPVVVESAQSRRLPYLQVLGGSGKAATELRERVVAAIDSSRLRIPARRITVQIQPGAHGLALELLDLAVAVAILGGNGQFPAFRVENLLICGSLGLDGSLRPLENKAALRRLLDSGAYRSALLPWSGSEVLSSVQVGLGGGFRSLADLIEFLRGQRSAERASAEAESEPPPPSRIWDRIPGQAVAKRLLEVSAAGHHHAMLVGPASARADLLAHALSALLPPLEPAEAEEVRSIYSAAGLEACPARPFHRFGTATVLPPLLPQRGMARFEEALLAHRGVLYLERVVEQEERLLPGLAGPMRAGRFELSLSARRVRVPANPLVVAHSRLCACGGLGSELGPCVCRPTEGRRYRERWRRLLASSPFDLFLRLEASGLAGPAEEDLDLRCARVAEARARMNARQGVPNGRLAEGEAVTAKRWTSGASALLGAWQARDRERDSGALARVALTISDLRGGEDVEERDLFEARHYFFDLGGEAAGVSPGRKAASSSVPETNSIAIP